MNKVILIGRLTADPELRQSASGANSCRFTVAVDRKFPDKETGERKADFITCVAFNKTSEHLAKWFTKGKMIVVEGNLRTGSYKDKSHEDVTHYTTDVWVDNIEFAGDGKSSNNSEAQAPQAAPAVSEPVTDDDVPF